MKSTVGAEHDAGWSPTMPRNPVLTWLLACLLCGVVFVRAVDSVVETGMASEMPFWVEQAIPVVLTDRLCDGAGNYTSRAKLHTIFNDGRSSTVTLPFAEIDRRIHAVLETAPEINCAGKSLSMGNDDKGIADFVRLGFFLFGPQAGSIIVLYGLLLAISIVLYLICFWHRAAYTAGLITLLMGIGSIMPFIAADTNSASLLALRAFPILSMVACLNVLVVLTAIAGGEVFYGIRQRMLAACVLQILLIVFVAHIRTTAVWQFVAISVVALPVLWIRRKYHTPRFLTGFALACVLLPLVHAVAYPLWQRLTYAPIYRNAEAGELHSRVFYHNIFSGFAFSPALRDRYGIRIDDWSVMQATSRYMEAEGRIEEFERVLPPGTDAKAPRGQIRNWSAYEAILREMVLKTMNEHPTGVVEAIRWKLVWFGQYIGWVLGVRDELPPSFVFEPLEWKWDVAAEFERMKKMIASQSPRPTPATPVNLALLALAGLCLGNRYGVRSLVAIPVIAAASLIPVIVGYPSVWGSFDGAVGTLAALAGLVVLAIATVLFLGREIVR